jgi:solute carrier family 35 protein E1
MMFLAFLLLITLVTHVEAFSAMIPMSCQLSTPFRRCTTSTRHRTALFGPPTSNIVFPLKNQNPTALSAVTSSDELSPEEVYSAHRMRRRKSAILQKKKKIKIASLFALWYILSVGYNIFSKRVLNLAPELAWTTAWLQMALGLLYVGPMWLSGMRVKPELTKGEIVRLLPIAFLHTLVHVGGVISMGAGAVSFTYIVKASEPAISAALSALVLKTFLPLPVYLTLIPVMVGVALTSVSELTFSWKAFNYAMLSNVASASRGIVGKRTMRARALGKSMNAMNLYAVLTMLSTVLLFPITLLLEGPVIQSAIQRLLEAGQGPAYAAQVLAAALFYYTYNEVAFLCLDNVSPVSHAIGNTLKRVFIISSSILVFGNRMTPQGILGSVLAIGGVFLYSLATNNFKR